MQNKQIYGDTKISIPGIPVDTGTMIRIYFFLLVAGFMLHNAISIQAVYELRRNRLLQASI